jgi:LysR family glycine cleavage system transcriptional activator
MDRAESSEGSAAPLNKRQRLPLAALRTFEAAVRLESFKDAAEELGVSATTVSNQIRMLESNWGCQLFVRNTRQVVPTEIGQSLGRVVRQSFDAIEQEIEHHIANRKVSVSLAVGAIFGARWIMPRLEQLRQDLPQIALTLRRGRRVTSPNDMPATVVVDWGLGDWPGLESEPLMRIEYTPVLSPSLMKKAPSPLSVQDLRLLPLLHQQDRSEWTAWLQLAGASTANATDEMIIEDSHVATQAALLGQGVVLGILPFIEDDLNKGLLVQPFEKKLRPAKAYYLLTRPGAQKRPEVRAVCDWLRKAAAEYARLWPQTDPGAWSG